MSNRDERIKTVERMIEEVWNQKRLDVLADLYHPDANVHLSSGVMQGRDRLRDEFIQPTQQAFPDLYHEILDIFVEGNKVAMRYTGSGTHLGDFDGKKATGKSFSYEGIIIFHLKDNRVADVWNQSDWSTKFVAL